MLREHEIEADRIQVIRSAVDVTAFSRPENCDEYLSEFGLGGDTVGIAAAGQLIARKGHSFLLQAVAEIVTRNANRPVRLVIFGEGPLETELRAQAAQLGLGDVVQFAGFRDDLDRFIACFDIFAHPALQEGLGVAALKAAAASLPVIGFDAGGLREAVENNATGLLVAPEDSVALADALSSLIDDGELRERFGAAGRERMQKSFSIDTMAARHVTLYESILNG